MLQGLKLLLAKLTATNL